MQRNLGLAMQKEKEKQEECGPALPGTLPDTFRSKTVSPDPCGSQQACSCSEPPRYTSHSSLGDVHVRKGAADVWQNLGDAIQEHRLVPDTCELPL